MQRFTTTLRVRHYEMDVLGHVNNAVYLHYLEQAAIEHSEQLGLTMADYQKLGGVFILRKLAIDYLLPAVAGDRLVITTWIKEMRGPRCVRLYQIRQESSDQIVATAEALWAWVEQQTMRPRPIPQTVLDTFNPPQTGGHTPKPLLCSRCATPLESQGLQPRRARRRPTLFTDQQPAAGQEELIEVYVCPNCGQREIFHDSDYPDDEE
jgi:acyl-CoA thioester hydrolase